MLSKKNIGAFLMVCLALCSNRVFAGEYPPDIQRILDKKKIVIAMLNRDQPPFFVKGKDGRLEGLDVELARGVAMELGVEAEFNRSAKTFNETVDMVVAKEADIVISKLSQTLPRAKKILFTKPYIVLRKGLLINRLKMARARKGKPPAEFIQSVKGDIGAIAGSSYVEFGRRMFPGAEIKEYPAWADVVNAVIDGDVIAGFRDELEIKKIIRMFPDQAIKIQSAVFKDTKDPIAIAVSSDAFNLLAWLNQYLDFLNLEMNADKLLKQFSYMFKKNTAVEKNQGDNSKIPK